MKNNLSCEIVRDLLPSYIDHVLSDTSVQAVEEHIRECGACAKVLEDMRLSEEVVQENRQQDREIDYLKKVKRRHRLVVCCILTVVVLLAIPAVEIIKNMCFGEYILKMDYDVTVSDDQVAIKGEVLDGFTTAESKINEKDGIVDARIYYVPSTFFRQKKEVDEVYRPKADVQKVYINGELFWEKDTGTDMTP